MSRKLTYWAVTLVFLALAAGCSLTGRAQNTAEGREQILDRVRDRVGDRVNNSSSPLPTPSAATKSDTPSSFAQRDQTVDKLVDIVGDRVVDRVNSSSCQELEAVMQQAKARKGENQAIREKLMAVMQKQPKLRAKFINKVAGPFANKLFDCRLIPLN